MLAVGFALLLGLCASLPAPQGGLADRPVGITVVVVDVGQGDGVVLRAPDGTIHVVDGGPNGRGVTAVLPVVDSLQPQAYGFTFLTHFHDDHQGGLDEVLQRGFLLAYDRGNLRRTNTSTHTNNYLNAAGNRRRTVGAGDIFALGGGATLRCVAVNGNIAGGGFVDPVPSAQEENSRSIAMRLDYGLFSMWLGGDLTGGGNGTADVESLAALACGDVDVYMLNHHGSNTSSSTNLLTRLQPELAVVSCGNGNSYGHPTPTVVNRINQAAAARVLLSTSAGSANTIGFGVVGNLRIDSDGQRYRATAQNGDFLDFWCDELVVPPATASSLRISELQRQPAMVPDTAGEYVEIANFGPRPVGLRGLSLSGNSGTVTIASQLALMPGRSLLLQRDGGAARNGGLPLGLPLPFGSLSLGDSNDSLLLRQDAVVLDSLSYTAGFPGGPGVAAERRNLAAPASAANFAAATVPYGLGDLGSPGRRNDADTTPHGVQIAVDTAPGSFTLHATAIGRGPVWSAVGVAFGRLPGFTLFGSNIPLNLDPLLQSFLGLPAAIAPLPADGYRSLRVELPNPSPLVGLPVFAAHVLLDLQQVTVPGVSVAIPFLLP